MSVDDVTVMWRNLPQVFDQISVPTSWEDEWSFGTGDPDPTARSAPRNWLDHVIEEDSANLGARSVSDEGRRSGPTLSDDLGFGGAPRLRDDAFRAPPPDTLGFYLPFHYFYPDWWGIYIVAEGVRELATWLWDESHGGLSYPTAAGLAYQFIYRHESFHHAVEAFGSRLEVTHRIPVFRTSVRAVRRQQIAPNVTDEALASGYALQHCSDWLRERHPAEHAVGERTLRESIRLQPPPYNAALEFDTRDSLVRGRDRFAEEIQRETKPELPGLPTELWSMFGHAFTGFTRANSRVHYVVRRDSRLHQLMSEDGFFLRYRDLERKLQRAGCWKVREGRGSHVIWAGPSGTRAPVPRHGGRDLAPGTLRAILRTLGIDVGLTRFMAL